MDEKWGIRVKSTGVLDDFPCSLDGLVQVLKLSFFSLVMLPVCSFGLDARTDMIIRKAFSDESQCVSEVSTGVIVLLIAVSGKVLTHTPQRGTRGKEIRLSDGRSVEGFRDSGLLLPVNPDEFS